jgi:two-component system, sporulation sensor kinase B
MFFKKAITKLPIYRKALFFSFFISFIVVFFIAGITYVYQFSQLEKQLTNQAVGVANLWSHAISHDDVKKAIESHNKDHQAVKRLNKYVTMINERNSEYLGGYLLSPILTKEKQVSIIASSKHYRKLGFDNFTMYTPGESFLGAFRDAIDQKKVTSSAIYKDKYGTWMSVYSPILDGKGKILAVLNVDVDASIINSYKWRMGVFFILVFLATNVVVYFTLSWGLKRAFAPLNEIIRGINAVSAGDFHTKLHINEQSDLILLSERFNLMTEQLSLLFDKLSDTYKEFSTEPKNDARTHRIEEAIGEMEHIIEKTRTQKELQRAEKMNAIGQLAASVAHEIRNPMTVVKGFLQIFLVKDHLSEEEHMFIRLMIEELNRAEIIINDYLSLARPDLEKTEKVDANDLAAKVMDLMNSYALMSKNVEVQTHFGSHVYMVGNKSELQQVLINLLKNAIEAMGNGGVLTLTVKTNAAYGIFEITDTGIGMSIEELKRLGTAFYSLKEKGTGIGLMVCYQIVERMKGKIEVESKKGSGTTFKIYVPLWNPTTPMEK